jgi:ABC transport system ATP-binding/permease protein
MSLVIVDNLALHYGEQVIFDGIQLRLEAGERLCLVGRNGVGKSTLLKVLLGEVVPDSGSIWQADGLRMACLMQELPPLSEQTVVDYVAGGLPKLAEALREYEALSQRAADLTDAEMAAWDRVQAYIESQNGWQLSTRISEVLDRLSLPAEAPLKSLSGGWRRRAALARALVVEPDVLLLDEPTNHLDIQAIEWLENWLDQYAGAVVFVTHDRAFLQRVANRIGELDRGKLSVWRGHYNDFLAFRERQLHEEAKHQAEFDKHLAKEEIWIRQGVKARRTRNEGRVRALKALRQERLQRRETLATARMQLQQEAQSGKLIAELEGVHFAYAGKPLVKDLSLRILRGDKIGLIGPNGAGKTTLLRLILGELQPSAGTLVRGTRLEVAYFDQLREQLDLSQSAMDNIAMGREYIDINGKPRHAISYLNDFLFTGERARTPIRVLSGGERHRVLLAKLFSQPANVLVLDEPTNDLDAETLDLLEELLIDYTGTVLIVSHDRQFMDNVVTSTLAFEGEGRVREYVGGYSDWVRQGGLWPSLQPAVAEAQLSSVSGSSVSGSAAAAAPQVVPSSPAARKLSYKLQRELDELPARIESLEIQIAALAEQSQAADFYQQSREAVSDHMAKLADLTAQLDRAFERWQELDAQS